MSLKKNTALRNDQADFLGAIFDGGTLEIYTGVQPANPNDSPTGDLLCTITLPTPAFQAASGGVIVKSGAWQDTASDTGTAGWARFISADTNYSMDVGCSDTPGVRNTLLLNDLDIAIGNTVTVVSLTITVPET
jgi:hypothetical protein